MENINLSNYGGISRRDFIKNLTVGVSAFAFSSYFGFLHLSADEEGVIRAIIVDYDKCTGCRTCEAVCSAFNDQQIVNGETLPGSGNPFYSNIKVQHFNPDVDVPALCALCPDAPCIKACPVPADSETGRKALYRDENIFTIKSDPERCIGCGKCAEACKAQGVGVIIPNHQTNKPERICTLCDGDPQCVKYCPFGALSYVEVDTKKEFYGMSPDDIAKELNKRFYDIQE